MAIISNTPANPQQIAEQQRQQRNEAMLGISGSAEPTPSTSPVTKVDQATRDLQGQLVAARAMGDRVTAGRIEGELAAKGRTAQKGEEDKTDASGRTALDILREGGSDIDLAAGRFSLEERDAALKHFRQEELTQQRRVAAQDKLKAAGLDPSMSIDLSEALTKGLSPDELKVMGFAPAQVTIAKVQYDARLALKDYSFPDGTVDLVKALQSGKVNNDTLVKAGFNYADRKAAQMQVNALSILKEHRGPQGDYNVTEALSKGVSETTLRAAGIGQSDIDAAKSARIAQLSEVGRPKEAELPPSQPRAALDKRYQNPDGTWNLVGALVQGVSAKDMEAAGFTQKDIQASQDYAKQSKVAEINLRRFDEYKTKAGNYDLAMAFAKGADPQQARLAGFSELAISDAQQAAIPLRGQLHPGALTTAKNIGREVVGFVPILGTALAAKDTMANWDKMSGGAKVGNAALLGLYALGDVIVVGGAIKVGIRAVGKGVTVQRLIVEGGRGADEAVGFARTAAKAGKPVDLIANAGTKADHLRGVQGAVSAVAADPTLARRVVLQAPATPRGVQTLLKTDAALQEVTSGPRQLTARLVVDTAISKNDVRAMATGLRKGGVNEITVHTVLRPGLGRDIGEMAARRAELRHTTIAAETKRLKGSEFVRPAGSKAVTTSANRLARLLEQQGIRVTREIETIGGKGARKLGKSTVNEIEFMEEAPGAARVYGTGKGGKPFYTGGRGRGIPGAPTKEVPTRAGGGTAREELGRLKTQRPIVIAVSPGGLVGVTPKARPGKSVPGTVSPATVPGPTPSTPGKPQTAPSHRAAPKPQPPVKPKPFPQRRTPPTQEPSRKPKVVGKASGGTLPKPVPEFGPEPAPRPEPGPKPGSEPEPVPKPLPQPAPKPEPRAPVTTKATGQVRKPYRIRSGTRDEELPMGHYPRVMEFVQGVVTYRLDLDTGGRQVFRTPERRRTISPEESLRVIRSDTTAPKEQKLRQGLFDIKVTPRAITFRRRRGF